MKTVENWYTYVDREGVERIGRMVTQERSTSTDEEEKPVPRKTRKQREDECLRDAVRAVDIALLSGVVGKGARRVLCKRLEDEGFLTYVAHGYEEDGNPDREWPIYAATAKGRARIGADPAAK